MKRKGVRLEKKGEAERENREWVMGKRKDRKSRKIEW